MDEGKRVIITVIGHDKIGIIARIASVCASNDINILDISQTILQEFFTMIMVVDLGGSKVDVAGLRELLNHEGEKLELKVSVQHEDIFKFMHRI